MKRLILSFALVAAFVSFPVLREWPVAVLHAAISVVESCTDADTNSGTTSVCTLPSVQSGDVIVAMGGVEGTQTWAFTDDRNAAGLYSGTLVTSLHAGNNTRSSMAWAIGAAAGSTVVTATVSSAQYRWMCAVLLRNVSLGAAQGSNTATSTASTTLTGGTVATTGSAILVGIGSSPSATWTVGNGFTQLQENENNAFHTGNCEYKTVTGTTDGPVWTTNNTNNKSSVTAAFGELAAGGAVNGPKCLLLGAC